jgi:hypothetical protein
MARDLAEFAGFAVEVIGRLFAERPGLRKKGVEAGRPTDRVSGGRVSFVFCHPTLVDPLLSRFDPLLSRFDATGFSTKTAISRLWCPASMVQGLQI